MSYESRWALNALVRNDAMKVDAEAYACHDALMAHNVTADGLDPREDLAKYRLVIAPRLYCIDDAVAQNLRQYVADGGVLCLTPRSGAVDEYNVIFNAPAPGPLADVAGVEVDDYGALDAPLPPKGEAGPLPAGVQVAETWADEIIVTTAQVLATYDAGWTKAM
ncbi:MAG: beta-galactosidase trimerization domain-containing protein, partial [Anaerolineae bacterium]|nr:beta-galactosidase trimerization domain-containing protein [Anaerolineae bacterium]